MRKKGQTEIPLFDEKDNGSSENIDEDEKEELKKEREALFGEIQ